MADYWQACVDAAEHQGLSEMCDKLEQLFGADAGLYQSGGFCMVVQVDCPVGYTWVTFEGDWDDGKPVDGPESWLVGYYTDDEGQDGVYTYTSFANVPEVIAHHQRRSTPPPDPASSVSFDEAEAAGVDGTLRDM